MGLESLREALGERWVRADKVSREVSEDIWLDASKEYLVGYSDTRIRDGQKLGVVWVFRRPFRPPSTSAVIFTAPEDAQAFAASVDPCGQSHAGLADLYRQWREKRDGA